MHSSGCWFSKTPKGVSGSCTMIPDGHSLLAALATLDDRVALELLRRFLALLDKQRVELWRRGNDVAMPERVSGHEREVTRTVAENAGWDDLAVAWPP